MAIVTRFSRVIKDRVGRPKDTECGFCSVEIDGAAYLLLETYGAADRAMPGKVSQSLHLDRHHAAELKPCSNSSSLVSETIVAPGRQRQRPSSGTAKRRSPNGSVR